MAAEAVGELDRPRFLPRHERGEAVGFDTE